MKQVRLSGCVMLLVLKDERCFCLGGHFLPQQRFHDRQAEFETGPRPSTRHDVSVFLHAVLRVFVVILTGEEKGLSSYSSSDKMGTRFPQPQLYAALRHSTPPQIHFWVKVLHLGTVSELQRPWEKRLGTVPRSYDHCSAWFMDHGSLTRIHDGCSWTVKGSPVDFARQMAAKGDATTVIKTSQHPNVEHTASRTPQRSDGFIFTAAAVSPRDLPFRDFPRSAKSTGKLDLLREHVTNFTTTGIRLTTVAKKDRKIYWQLLDA